MIYAISMPDPIWSRYYKLNCGMFFNVGKNCGVCPFLIAKYFSFHYKSQEVINILINLVADLE